METPLYIAIKAKNYDAIVLLIELGAHLNIVMSDEWSCLGMAVNLNSYNICKVLIEEGADVNQLIRSSKFTALHLAAYNKDMNICELLINNSANINAVDTYKRTPLFNYILSGGCIEGISTFIKYGANKNVNINGAVICTVRCKCGMNCNSIVMELKSYLATKLVRGIMFHNKT